jgi:ABC-type dipeptide/oligopeptide/nickel transport system permease component
MPTTDTSPAVQASSQPDPGSPFRGPTWGRLVGTLGLIGQRLAFGAVVLVSIAYLSHFGLAMARGGSFNVSIGKAASETLHTFLKILSGDLGLSTSATSTLNPIPVAEVLSSSLRNSLGLLAVSLGFAVLVGLPLGLLSSRIQRSGWSLIILFLTLVGISLPSFFAAFLLQRLVIRLTQSIGHTILPVGGFGWDLHLVLPAIVLAARPIAQITRVTFVSMRDVLSQDYIRTARGKGLAAWYVLNRHALRNTLIPIITTVGTSLRYALISLPVVELFFSWPGLGFNLLRAIARQDDDFAVMMVLSLGVLFILVNLLIDLSFRVVDPRLAASGGLVTREERVPLLIRLGEFFGGIKSAVMHVQLPGRSKKGIGIDQQNAFRSILAGKEASEDKGQNGEWKRGGRAWASILLGNGPLLIGTILVIALGVVFFFGDRLTTHSPFTTQGLTIVDGEMRIPPFEPGDEYPWGTDVLGRDIMSLVFNGAWQTLRLALIVVAARLVIGFILGALAGWNANRWLDRSITGLSEILSAFPSLLLAMTLILAIGIRKGFQPFIIALAFVGWGEVMQFVRAQVIAIRPKTFIEAALAVGQRTTRIVFRHVLPNLVPSLIVLSALEMGGVLMLLGELGFVGIFIGGGAFAELDAFAPPYHYSDVPEWSALLSNVRQYAYSYPWTGLYPALAFFIAILGFNLFGEGMRQLIEDAGVRVTRLINRYTVSFGIVALIALTWLRGGTGATQIYSGQAQAFSGQEAKATVNTLAYPGLEGRALGSEGMELAAQWIAMQFKDLGLQPAGEEFTYFQTRERDYEQIDSMPYLDVADRRMDYRKDFSEYPSGSRTMGTARGKVLVVAVGEQVRRGAFGMFPALEAYDFSDDIVLVASDREAFYMSNIPTAGILVVAPDPTNVQRRFTISSQDPRYRLFGTGREAGDVSPILWITETVANDILASADMTVEELRDLSEGLPVEQLVSIETPTTVEMSIEGTIVRKQPAWNVIGHLPGTSTELNDEMIIVMAKYDSAPMGPFGAIYPGANDNASGVAVMLEAIRAMQETGYQPNRTMLFVAYSGEGLEAGETVSPPKISRLLQAKRGFQNAFDVVAVVDLRGLGAGSGEGVDFLSGGSLRLVELFDEAARRVGTRAARGGEAVDLGVVFDKGSQYDSGAEAPWIGVTWSGWEETAGTPADTLDRISAEKLERSGRCVTLGLMILGREREY